MAVACPWKQYEQLGCGEDVGRSVLRYQHAALLQARCDPHLFDPRSQEASHKEFESLQFRLYDDQFEVRLGVHVACLIFDQFNLAA